MNFKESLKVWGPILAMLMVQLVSGGLQILSKMILTEGIFIFSLITYRHIIAAVCIFPFAYYFERGGITRLTWMAGVWVFLTSLFGIMLAIGLFYYGLKDTTATYATNFLSLIPVTTFVLSIVTRVDRLDFRTIRGNARIAGAMFCLAGAAVLSGYKGHELVSDRSPTQAGAKPIHPNFKVGTIELYGSVISYALWFIAQEKLMKVYPLKYWATMLTCISASLQAVVVGLVLDRKPASWKLHWDFQLMTIVYSGVLASAGSFCLISSAVETRGASFPAMFYPLSLMLVCIVEVSALGQELRLGSLIGMLVIIGGLYTFLWGSSGRNKSESTLPISNDSGEAAPAEAHAEPQAEAAPAEAAVAESWFQDAGSNAEPQAEATEPQEAAAEPEEAAALETEQEDEIIEV